MSQSRRKSDRRWYAYLSTDEAEKLARVEEEADLLDKRRRDLTGEAARLRNRAYHHWQSSLAKPLMALAPTVAVPPG
jgi:hypothetical protein